MPRRIELSSIIDAPRDRVWAFYDDPDNLPKLTPPGIHVTLLSQPARPRIGDVVSLRIRRGPIAFNWDARFTEYDPGRSFVDEQGRGPFSFFRHRHLFEDDPGGTRMTDTIDYIPPFGPIGWIADRIAIARDLKAMLEFRHARTRELLENA